MKAIKVRLYPNEKQQKIISFQFGAVRYIYNRTLALKKYAYEKFGIKISKFDLIKRITVLKNRNSTSWLKNANSQSLQQSVINVDKAYKNFFNGSGYPLFKNKHNSRQSYQYPSGVKIKESKIYLPKIGWVKCRGLHEDIVGKIKTVTISHEANQYHASILIESEETVIQQNNGSVIGIDVGVSFFVTDSNGNQVKSLNLINELSKLRIRAQQLSRKKKNSNNHVKAKARLAKQNLRIANIRKDFLHKLSKQYSENQTVVVEDLKIKNMVKSSEGTKERPGKNVAQKRGLNRSITQQSWGMFFELLKYKTINNGGEFVKVNPKFTSQMCNKCGYISSKNRLTQASFVCISCGHSDNADVNAAKNIKERYQSEP